MFKVVEAAESNSNEDNYMDMKFHFQIFNKIFAALEELTNGWLVYTIQEYLLARVIFW